MMMNRVSAWVPGLLLASLSLSACLSDDKIEPTKGEVDEEGPPSDPTALTDPGKEDSSSQVVALTPVVQSAHPYTNSLNKTYPINLSTVAPACASQVRLHFSQLRTEAGYDYVKVLDGAGAQVQSFDGTKDNTW